MFAYKPTMLFMFHFKCEPVRVRLLEMTHSQGLPESLIEKESTKFAKIAWAGARQNDLFCGHFPDGLGHLLYQLEGNRLMATCSLEESCRLVLPDLDIEASPPQDLKQILKDRGGQEQEHLK